MSTLTATRPAGLPVAAGLLLAIAALTLVSRPVLPVEDRVLSVAWEMWLRQDYLVPMLNGEPYSHKPPLMYWMIILGWKIAGVNDWWPRVVPALFGLGCLLLTRRLALQLWPGDRDAADLAPLILVGTVFWAAIATTVMYDVLLAFFVLAGALGLVRAWEGRFVAGFALFGAALGFGILSKGPVALLHLGIPALLAPLWFAERKGRWMHWYPGIVAGVALGLAVAGAWAIPAAISAGGPYARAILWGQTADRMVSSFAHRQPFWWYLALLPLILFPWIIWPTLWRALARLKDRRLDSGTRLTLLWSGGGILAFSAISGKQAHYLLPLFPALALLAAHALSGLPAIYPRDRWLPALAVALFGAILAAIPFAGQRLGLPEWSGQIPYATGLFVVAGGVAMMLARSASVRAEIGKLAVVSALVMAALQAGVTPAVWNAYDLRQTANWVKSLETRGVPVAHVGPYYGQYHFLGRLEKPIETLEMRNLPAWFDRHPDGRAIVYLKPGDPVAGRAEFSQAYRGKTIAIIDRPLSQSLATAQ
jgi:4-amino-4-deoxy-L-arabinose transferase-like glycosyltransferase